MNSNSTDTVHAGRRRALVLGGTSGLGNAVARALIDSGSEVTITGRDLERTWDIAREIGASAAQLDLTNAESLKSFLPVISEIRPDQLILNSGGPAPASAIAISSDDVRRSLEFLLHSQIDIVAAAIAAMKAQGWGRIVAIGSSGVQQPIPALALSNIGRAALAAYLKSLAVDVAALGVTVNMVLPGRIATSRVTTLDSSAAAASNRSATEVRAESEASIPTQRYGTPREFASAVAYLCSEGASYVTGEQLRVDGGLIRHY
jgi:Dehydrogenases with different specificities (related to short-chain alcohol dehydrogenases)